MQVETMKIVAHARLAAMDSFLEKSRIYLESPGLLSAAKTAALQQIATDSGQTTNNAVKPIVRWIGLRIALQSKVLNLKMRNLADKESIC